MGAALAHAQPHVTVNVSVPLYLCPPPPVVTACPPMRFVWRVRAPRDTTPQDRTPGLPGVPASRREVDLFMDLQADKQAIFELAGVDEVGNPTALPEDVSVTFEVDNPAVIVLTDNGDGTGNVAATGLLGVATLTGTVSRDGAPIATGVAAIQVVAGDAETFGITFGIPTEVTPDEEPPAAPEVPAEPVV